MNRILKYTVWALLALCYYSVYTNSLSHIIAYHEQHHLFLFTEAYFQQQVHSAGIFSYLTDFIIQFFHYPELGSALLAILIASVYPLTRSIIRKLFGKEDILLLSVIPSLLLFFHTMEAGHSLIPITISVLALTGINLLLWIFRRYLPLIPVFRNLHIQKKGVCTGITVMAILAYAGYGYHHFTENFNKEESLMLKAEMNVKARKWENVLKYTREYLNLKKTNQQISYFHHLALYHTGQLTHRLFDYPHPLGMNSLFIPWSTNIGIVEYGHYLYEDLGLINEAHRWEFEAMTAWGETAPHLLKLARYNIINHRPKVARRFLNKLKSSLFYREEALKLEATMESGKVEGLRNALAEVPDSITHFTNPVDLKVELTNLCNQDPTNRMAFEYLMCNLLLGNYVTSFVENLQRIRHFDHTPLPAIFEEALVVYQLKAGEEAFAKTGFTISEATQKRFDRYYELSVKKQMVQLQREFGRTFWFYLNHTTPYKKKQ